MCEGDVFFFCVDPAWDFPPHPKIVLFLTSSRQVIFVHATKNRARAERMCRLGEPNNNGPLKTLVEITANTCAGISQRSWIACNGYYEEDEYAITSHHSYTHCGSATHPIMGAIRVGLLRSDIAPEKQTPIRESLIARSNGLIPF